MFNMQPSGTAEARLVSRCTWSTWLPIRTGIVQPEDVLEPARRVWGSDAADDGQDEPVVPGINGSET
jgi:hypothetical protein